MKDKPFSVSVQKNLLQLKAALQTDRVSLLLVMDRRTGDEKVMVCATNPTTSDPTGPAEAIPYAIMIEGNPAEQFIAPDEIVHWKKTKEENIGLWLVTAPEGTLKAEVQENNKHIIEKLNELQGFSSQAVEEECEFWTSRNALIMKELAIRSGQEKE